MKDNHLFWSVLSSVLSLLFTLICYGLDLDIPKYIMSASFFISSIYCFIEYKTIPAKNANAKRRRELSKDKKLQKKKEEQYKQYELARKKFNSYATGKSVSVTYKKKDKKSLEFYVFEDFIVEFYPHLINIMKEVEGYDEFEIRALKRLNQNKKEKRRKNEKPKNT